MQVGARKKVRRRRGARVDHRAWRRRTRGHRIEAAAACRQRSVRDFDDAHRAGWIAGIADMDHFRQRAERREVSAGIDDALGDPAVAQRRGRTIDRIALGDAAEIDPDAAVTKGDPVVGENDEGLAHTG
jgi:hypothetical protein